jgi:hypothetical protein
MGGGAHYGRPARARAAVALAAALGLLAPDPGAAEDADSRAGKLRAWSADYGERCLLAERPEGAPELRDLAARLAAEGPLSDYLGGLISGADVVLCLDPQAPGCRGYYEPVSHVIAFSPELGFDEKLLVAVHELRHVDQIRRGFVPPLSLDRREYVRLVYALEADAQALATLYAWTERAAGRPEVWAAAETLEHYEDIPAAFAAELDATGDAGLATRAAFSAWYASDWRRETYYHSACGQYLDQLDRAHLVPRYETWPAGYLDALCLLPDGTNYGCHLTDEILTRGRHAE